MCPSEDGDLRDPLVGALEKSCIHASCEGPFGIPLKSQVGLRSSSGFEAGTSVFHSFADMDFGVLVGFPQGSQASSRVETFTSALLSTWKSSVSHPVRLTYGSVAFSRGATGLSHLPLCLELFLGVTVESVQGSQVYLEFIGTLGSF